MNKLRQLKFITRSIQFSFGQQKNEVIFNQIQNRKDKNNKIEINREIQGLKTNDQFFSFFKVHQQQMNIVNLTSYLRRFVDLQINQNTLKEEIGHSFSVLEYLIQKIENQKYQIYGDRPKDIARSFSMLLSVQTEIYLKSHNQKILQYVKKIFNIIKEQKSYDLFNILELATFYRCISIYNNFIVKEDKVFFQEYLKTKNINNIDLHILCKFLHSISTMNIEIDKTIFLKLVLALTNRFQQQKEIAKLNHMDISSLFISIKTFHAQEDINYEEIQVLLTDLQSLIYKTQINIPLLTLGVIYNSLARIVNYYKIDQILILYLERNFKKCNFDQMNIQILAHIFQYYEISKQQIFLENEMLEKLENFICNQEFKNQSDTDFFFLLLQSLANCKIMFLQVISKLPIIFKQVQRLNFLNEFCIIQSLTFLKQVKVTNSGLREFTSLVSNSIISNKTPISIQSFLSILNVIQNFLFEDIAEQLLKYIQLQLSDYGEQIIIEKIISLTETQFLQSLIILNKIQVILQNPKMSENYQLLNQKFEILIYELFLRYLTQTNFSLKTEDKIVYNWILLGINFYNAELRNKILQNLQQQLNMKKYLLIKLKQEAINSKDSKLVEEFMKLIVN